SSRTSTGPVLRQRSGRAWSESSMRAWRINVLGPAGRMAGAGVVQPDRLRHTLAALLIGEGQSVLEVARQLGLPSSRAVYLYRHLIEDFADADRISAPVAIARARRNPEPIREPTPEARAMAVVGEEDYLPRARRWSLQAAIAVPTTPKQSLPGDRIQ